MLDLTRKRVAVTGGGGFLGSHLVDQLRARGAKDVFVVRSAQYDLTREEDVARFYREASPEVVIHLAAVVGGIGANRENPGRFFYENMLMGVHTIEHARRAGVEKLVCLGTICAYPKHTPVPFRESDLWSGYPEETNAPYGVAKRALLVQLQAYREQYDLHGVYLMPVNLYGPRDSFGLQSSHVIPALIRKCLEARRSEADQVEVWGTGRATREFLFVEDCAEAILLAAERYDGPEPVNVGTGQEISIRELAAIIAEITGFRGRLSWDASKPDGQPRRCLDTTQAEALFGFRARMPLREGLEKTVAWYEALFDARGPAPGEPADLAADRGERHAGR